jgi:hypothetical protein
MKIDVLTNRYNPSRTGANTSETQLNHINVNVNDFGKIFTRGVDGQIYPQPLIVSDLDFGGGVIQSIVIVATSRNMVYAFDAEVPSQCHPVWRVDLDPAGATPVPRLDYGPQYQDFTAEIGITSTPVIDRTAGIVYLTSKTKLVVNGTPHYACRLHALDLRTGAEKPGSPAIIAETAVKGAIPPDNTTTFGFVSGPSVPGTGEGSVGGTVTFNVFYQLQRPGLLLQDGVLYLAFASQGDEGTFHGWVLAYDASNLKFIDEYCTTPNWGEGGIWQSGCGLAGDGAGGVFAVCGNGENVQNDPAPVLPIAPNPTNGQLASGPWFGHSLLKLALKDRKLTLVDWYTPFDILDRNKADDDMCAGPVILPWKNLVGAWGKDRAYHIADRDNLGKFTVGRNNIVQFATGMTAPVNGGGTAHIHCAPVFFEDPVVGPVSYVWGENDKLRGHRFDLATSQFEIAPPPNLLTDSSLPVGMPGGMLSISSDGDGAAAVSGSSILWALHPTLTSANRLTVSGVLQAFRADDIRQPIYSSNHDPRGTDDLGDFAKFCPPVIANGRVYVATFSQQLVVYGLLSEGLGDPLGGWKQDDIPEQAGANTTFRVEGTASFSCNRFTILGSGTDIWDPSDAFHFVYQTVKTDGVSITARVLSVQPTDPWAKAGVMIRESLDAISAHAMMIVTPGNGVAFQFRSTNGGTSANVSFTTPIAAPCWVRLARTGNAAGYVFTGSVSIDGVNWSQVGQSTFAMATSAFAGMPVCAHTPNTLPRLQDLCLAVIDKVTLVQ